MIDPLILIDRNTSAPSSLEVYNGEFRLGVFGSGTGISDPVVRDTENSTKWKLYVFDGSVGWEETTDIVSSNPPVVYDSILDKYFLFIIKSGNFEWIETTEPVPAAVSYGGAHGFYLRKKKREIKVNFYSITAGSVYNYDLDLSLVGFFKTLADDYSVIEGVVGGKRDEFFDFNGFFVNGGIHNSVSFSGNCIVDLDSRIKFKSEKSDRLVTENKISGFNRCDFSSVLSVKSVRIRETIEDLDFVGTRDGVTIEHALFVGGKNEKNENILNINKEKDYLLFLKILETINSEEYLEV